MISVIVPIYNAEKFLNRCIESLVGQTYTDLEIILVDDGSKDNCLQLCNDWAGRDRRIKVVSQANQGVSAARNAGLKMAAGTYVMFVDSDDYMKPDMCATMLSALCEKNADIVICGTEENGGHYWKPQCNRDYLSLADFKKDFTRQLNTELLSPPWNKIYRKNKIKFGFPDEVSFGEDLIFNLSYLKDCQRISFITNSPFFHEKGNENSLARNVSIRRLDEIEKIQDAVCGFYESREDVSLYNKYVKDLLCYLKPLLLSDAIGREEKVSTLKGWRRCSHLHSVKILQTNAAWYNKCLLLLLKYGFLQPAYWVLSMDRCIKKSR